MNTKEEILLTYMHKSHTRWKELDEIFPKGQLKLVLAAMEEYARQTRYFYKQRK